MLKKLNNSKPAIASFSIDVDNCWSYQKTHGDASWQSFPSYYDRLIPLLLDFLDKQDIKTTFFIVGKDIHLDGHREYFHEIIRHGHELGNHSYYHDPLMHFYQEQQIFKELYKTHQAMEDIIGVTPIGFRAPGFGYSNALLGVIKKLGYAFDASLLPSSLSPIAKIHYLWFTKMSKSEREKKKRLFGKLSDSFHSIKPFKWHTSHGELLEIPVTTMPLLRTPFHISYILWLSQHSKLLALKYFKYSIKLCRLRNIQPSILLHPTDILGCDDAANIDFFPTMNLSQQTKLDFLNEVFTIIKSYYDIVPMSAHAAFCQQEQTKLLHIAKENTHE